MFRSAIIRLALAAALAVAIAFAPLGQSQAAEAIKVLGQSNPSATTATTLYTVPASTSTVVARIVIANQSSSAGTFRIAVRIAGASLTAAQYIAYDVAIPGNETVIFPAGITLAATDVITIYASSANMSFNAFGAESS